MSSSIIEHVVLLNIKDEADPERVNDMVNGLNELNSLDEVVYLTVGPILRTRSSPLKLTHLVHVRYQSKSDLTAYLESPAHVSAAEELVRPICEDVLAVDWEMDGLDGPTVPRPGSALRLTLLKMSSDNEEAHEKSKEVLMEGLAKIKDKSGGPFEQISFGENFSPLKAKGYSFASLVVFPDLNELDASEEYEDQMRSLVDKVKHSLDYPALIALDYIVPRLHHPTPLYFI